MLPDPFPTASAAARHHAEIEAPRESVGIVIDDGAGHVEYVPLENVHPEPTRAFEISAADADQWRGQMRAVIHSHVLGVDDFDPQDGPLAAGPSAADMEQQAQMQLPWGLVTVIDRSSHGSVLWFGDEVAAMPGYPPVLERPFIHGIYDCYSLIRDSYRFDPFGFVREHFGRPSILLPDFPRDFAWWHDRDDDGGPRVPRNLYVDNFTAAGFHPIDRDELRAGDVILAQVRAEVVNHGGVYLGNGTWAHHLRGRLSTREPAGRWVHEYGRYFLRYGAP